MFSHIHIISKSRRETEDQLERLNELDGEQAGLLCQVLGARQVATLGGVARLRKKTSNFLDQVILRRAQLLAARLLEILFRDGDVFIRLPLVSSLLAR